MEIPIQVEKKMIECSNIFLPDEGRLCDTIIADNTDLTSNNHIESIDSVLSSLHFSGAKYRIYSIKT